MSILDCQQEYFLPGAIVQCTTCLGETVKGEVTAFDRHKKLLILKSAVSNAKQQVQFVNLEYVKDINIIKEQTPQQALLNEIQLQKNNIITSNFNYAKIQRRKQDEIERKRRSLAAVKVSTGGQAVFLAIRKTIDDIRWDGESIVVLEKILVRPPYKPDDVQAKSGAANVEAENMAQHIKKIIDKAWSSMTSDLSNSSWSSSTSKTNNLHNNSTTSNNCSPTSTASSNSESWATVVAAAVAQQQQQSTVAAQQNATVSSNKANTSTAATVAAAATVLTTTTTTSSSVTMATDTVSKVGPTATKA